MVTLRIVMAKLDVKFNQVRKKIDDTIFFKILDKYGISLDSFSQSKYEAKLQCLHELELAATRKVNRIWATDEKNRILPKGGEPLSKPIAFRCSRRLNDKIEQLCFNQKKTKSELILESINLRIWFEDNIERLLPLRLCRILCKELGIEMKKNQKDKAVTTLRQEILETLFFSAE
jgi:hypothetical protein